MMTMNDERIRELNKYIDTLLNLQRSGFNCKNEINVAVKALHEAMGFQQIVKEEKTKTNENKKHVIVIENDFDGVVRSVALFYDLLGEPTRISRIKDDHKLTFENAFVEIYKIPENKDSIRGLRADYIINNTPFNVHEYIKINK